MYNDFTPLRMSNSAAIQMTSLTLLSLINYTTTLFPSNCAPTYIFHPLLSSTINLSQSSIQDIPYNVY